MKKQETRLLKALLKGRRMTKNEIWKELSNEKLIFIEAALVYEADIETMFDYVVLIKSKFDIRLSRSIKERNFIEEDFRSRDKLQLLEKEKEKRADFVFSNNSSKEEFFKKADLLLLTLTGV